jgi:N-acyl amino acid synthase of PEP-CTERM/exosortase system
MSTIAAAAFDVVTAPWSRLLDARGRQGATRQQTPIAARCWSSKTSAAVPGTVKYRFPFRILQSQPRVVEFVAFRGCDGTIVGGPRTLPDFLNLGIGFRKYFTAVPALTDELKRAAYRIRCDVYCKDLSYEPVRPDGMETDAYDDYSEHCLLKSKMDEDYVGCIRLVFARPGDPLFPLPFERLCAATIDRAIVDPVKLPRDKIAEVSRLAVISQYRRRKGEAKLPASINDNDFGTPDRPRFPYITVGLYLGMMVQAQRRGIEMLFVLTEISLATLLSRLGIRLQRIGASVEQRGLRVPSLIIVDDVIGGFGAFIRPLYDVIADEINTAYRDLGL